MKQVVFFFPYESDTALTHPYQAIEKTQKRQQSMVEYFCHAGISVFMARGNESYEGGNTFYPQFHYTPDQWQKNTDSIIADLVLGFEVPTGVDRIFNTMRHITSDKTYCEKIFPDHTIPSILCENYDDIEKNFSRISTSLKVLKPRYGSKGRGIKIGQKLPKKSVFKPENFPYLLQEFFDTSSGFYEFPGLHDVRIIILAGKIIAVFLRQPKPGSYKANSYSQGNFIDLSEWQLPTEVGDLVKFIDGHFSDISHRYYSLDIGKNIDGELKIFELNSAPGLTTPQVGHQLAAYITKNILNLDTFPLDLIHN